MIDTSFKKESNRKPKIALKIAIFSIIAIFFMFFKVEVFATTFEDFESYSLGDLTTQSSWLPFQTNYEVSVVNEKAYSGTKSVRAKTTGETYVYNDTYFTSSTEGSIVFHVFVEHTDGNACGYWMYDIRAEKTLNNFGFKHYDNGCVVQYSTGDGNGNPTWTNYGALIENDWNTLTIEWELQEGYLFGRYKVNSGEYTSWALGSYGILYPYIHVVFLGPIYINGSNSYVDDIKDSYLPISGYHVSLELEKPIICQYNQVDLGAVEVKGRIDIPEDNLYTWDKLRFGFMNYNDNAYVQYFNATTTPLIAGEGLAFDYTFEISTSTSGACPSPNYPPCILYFGMWAYGRDSEGRYYAEYYPYGCDTYVGDASEMGYIGPPPEEIFPEYPELEECSGYELLERLICEIKNYLKSIFLPSSEKIQELKNTIDQFKQKFPFNYIAFLKDFHDDIKNGVNSTSTISFKVFGQSGDLDLSFWEKTASVGGITQTFSHIIKNLAIFSVLLVFLGWAISFGRRIFR
jgi:hypothetical protein